ncbi:VOC family protein [Cytobacillus dafuensis]|uniref:VOC family protein n=1 Tax=Cytobacillus dafuensis TaxID=1742359 RepID=A0A5B8ZAL4_CYTDA|nr:VOC family protein [Cytobacillus dafuensis]QED49907.1 VOC family protein [Cytobacillus dafuensis]
MNNEQQKEQNPKISSWRGFHHIALITRNLDETIRFYKNVLAMQVGTVYPAFKKRGRHCFIRPGNVETWGIHFFEYPDAQIFRSDEELKRLSKNPAATELYSFLPGALQHIAFAIHSEEEGLTLRAKLLSEGIIMTDIYDQGKIRNFIFTDNNGIQLEVAWPKAITN